MTVEITPATVVAAIMFVSGLIVCVYNAATAVARAYQTARAPEKTQDERLAKIETRLARHDELFDADKSRLDTIEEGNRVTQRAILALLSHGIDGNEIEGMKEAKDSLQKYLINR